MPIPRRIPDVHQIWCQFAPVCQIWCQSAQPFGSFSPICAKVSSAFSPLYALTRAKTRQKTTFYTSKMIIPAEHEDINVTNFLHSNLRSVQWRARRAVVPSCRRAVVPSCRRAVRACGTSLVRWMALQCAKRTARRLVCRKIILICFLWRSWHSPDFWFNVDPLKPKTFPLF